MLEPRYSLAEVREHLERIADGPWRIGVDENGTAVIMNGWNIDDNTMSLTCHADEHTIAFIANAPAYIQELVARVDLLEAGLDHAPANDRPAQPAKSALPRATSPDRSYARAAIWILAILAATAANALLLLPLLNR